jgi:hypothetical protein
MHVARACNAAVHCPRSPSDLTSGAEYRMFAPLRILGRNDVYARTAEDGSGLVLLYIQIVWLYLWNKCLRVQSRVMPRPEP